MSTGTVPPASGSVGSEWRSLSAALSLSGGHRSGTGRRGQLSRRRLNHFGASRKRNLTMSVINHTQRGGTALDLLEDEDLELRRLFAGLRARRGSSVEERAQYGDIAKEIIRHLATREAALVDLSNVASGDPSLQEFSRRFEQSMREHLPYIDRLEKMSRGVQGINLRVGQDFDGEMEQLTQVVGSEIEWELGVALPNLRGIFEATDRQDELKTAGHTSRRMLRPTSTPTDRVGGSVHRSSPA